jgi:2-keto-3-deoxy-L-rhamnonate aldolase RhmA
MTGKQIKEKLEQGQAVLGSWIQECRFPGLVQMYASAGLDFVIIDMEHSSIGSETVAEMILVGRRAGLATMVRVPDPLYHLMARPMDWGASGIVTPRVETAEQVRDIIRATKYSPLGERGMSTTTGHRDYHSIEPLGKYQARANEENLIIVQIESEKGVENIEEILGFPELDVIFIGPVDLSSSLGIPGETNHPRMQEAIEHIIQTAKKRKAALGILVGTMEAVRQWYDRGIRFLSWSNELRMITGAITKAVEEFRSFK